MHLSRLMTALAVPATFAGFASGAFASDLLVDDSGGAPYSTIGAAMLAANPGDRILVEPGSYPYFHFSRGVSVVGLGTAPGQVSIARCDFHVTIPTVGFDALLSNVTLGSDDPADAIALSGNEIGPGTLVVDGVVVNGGTFLRGGATGFHLFVNNSRFEPVSDEGFGGAAVSVGGTKNVVEFRNSRIAGWNAATTAPTIAGRGMNILGGTEARIVHTEIRGGNGSANFPGLGAGANALERAVQPGSVRIRIDGDSVIAGGNGAGAAGGVGVQVTGAITLGSATVSGGAGSPAGGAYSQAQPTALPADLYLELNPVFQNAETSGIVSTGSLITVSANLPAASTVIVIALDPATAAPTTGSAILAGNFTALDPAHWLAVVPGNSIAFNVPNIALALPGVVAQFQAYSFVPGAGILLTNTEAVRVDLEP